MRVPIKYLNECSNAAGGEEHRLSFRTSWDLYEEKRSKVAAQELLFLRGAQDVSSNHLFTSLRSKTALPLMELCHSHTSIWLTDTYTPIIFCIYIHKRRCSVAQGCFSSNTAVVMQKVRALCWSGNCALLQAAFSEAQWRSAATSKPIGTQLPAHPPAGPKAWLSGVRDIMWYMLQLCSWVGCNPAAHICLTAARLCTSHLSSRPVCDYWDCTLAQPHQHPSFLARRWRYHNHDTDPFAEHKNHLMTFTPG